MSPETASWLYMALGVLTFLGGSAIYGIINERKPAHMRDDGGMCFAVILAFACACLVWPVFLVGAVGCGAMTAASRWTRRQRVVKEIEHARDVSDEPDNRGSYR